MRYASDDPLVSGALYAQRGANMCRLKVRSITLREGGPFPGRLIAGAWIRSAKTGQFEDAWQRSIAGAASGPSYLTY